MAWYVWLAVSESGDDNVAVLNSLPLDPPLVLSEIRPNPWTVDGPDDVNVTAEFTRTPSAAALGDHCRRVPSEYPEFSVHPACDAAVSEIDTALNPLPLMRRMYHDES